MSFVVDLGQFIISLRFVEIGFGRADLFALECDQLLPLLNPVADADMDLGNPGRKYSGAA